MTEDARNPSTAAAPDRESKTVRTRDTESIERVARHEPSSQRPLESRAARKPNESDPRTQGEAVQRRDDADEPDVRRAMRLGGGPKVEEV